MYYLYVYFSTISRYSLMLHNRLGSFPIDLSSTRRFQDLFNFFICHKEHPLSYNPFLLFSQVVESTFNQTTYTNSLLFLTVAEFDLSEFQFWTLFLHVRHSNKNFYSVNSSHPPSFLTLSVHPLRLDSTVVRLGKTSFYSELGSPLRLPSTF